MHGYNIQNSKDLYCYNLLVITYLFDSELNEQRRKLLQGYVKNIVEALQENRKPQMIKSSYPLVWKSLKALHSTRTIYLRFQNLRMNYDFVVQPDKTI